MSHAAPPATPDHQGICALQSRQFPWWRVVVGLLLILTAVLVGVIVHSGFTQGEDQRVLDEFIEHRSPPATTFLEAVTNVFSPLGTILISTTLGLLFWRQSRNWVDAVYLLASVGGSAAITFALKQVFARSRPPVIDQLVNEVDFGFPSGHSTGIASLAISTAILLSVILTRLWMRVIIWSIALAFIPLVAGSRLYLGVHWFTDTFAGACIGIGTALALSVLLRRRRTSSSAADAHTQSLSG